MKPARRGRLKHADMQKLNINSSSIAGIIDNLRGQLAILEKDIRADREGQREYEIELEKLEVQKVDAVKRLETNHKWAEKFDKEIGPFEKTYENLTNDIHVLYSNAKHEHFKGLELLMDAFEYHPPFKRHDDTFSAVPFRPK